MYGQMTAGSWIYIGTQGILQGTYETFAELARQHFGGTLRGRVVLTAGLGGMGGAQPLAVTMNDGVCLAIEVDRAACATPARHRLRRPAHARPRRGACGRPAPRPRTGRQESIALVGNAAEIEPAWAAAGERFDVVTDQTSAHDALSGYVPSEIALADALELRRTQPDVYAQRAMRSMADHVRAMLAFQPAGAVAFDYGNNLRAQAQAAGVDRTPSTTRASCPRSSGRCSARARVRSAGPRCPATPRTSSARTRPSWTCSPRTRRSAAGSAWPRPRSRSRGCRRASAGWATASGRGPGRRSTTSSRAGEVRAPIVIGRDHLDAGSVASPNRETEAMADGSDAVADWPLLNALVNTAAGATWVSIHHGGGVGIGYSQHAGMVVVADGTPLAAEKLERVLTTDPGMGVVRHVDAGYDRAIEVARERGVRIPMLEGPG